MKRSLKFSFLVGLTLAAIAGVWAIKRIPQSVSYHRFCDERSLWGIPNFANVASNLAFVVIGVSGLIVLRRYRLSWEVACSYLLLFAGILLTGLGSGYYHWAPDNNTLIWDRLPMTIVFMSLLSAVLAEGIGGSIGAISLAPLLAIGTASVLWWHYTEMTGSGDLRLYVLVQYYPMILIPLVLLLFPSPAVRRGWSPLLWAFGWYGIAKVVEHWDCGIYTALGFVSGHSLKHFAAAASTGCLVRRFRLMGRQAGDTVY